MSEPSVPTVPVVQSLVRTLFEAIVGVAVLAKNPPTLEDFEKHGKLYHVATSTEHALGFALCGKGERVHDERRCGLCGAV